MNSLTGRFSDTRCAFLPRDSIHKRTYAVVRCLSGLSVTFVYCVETAKDAAIIAMEYE